MVEIHLYGKLRRLAPEHRANGNNVIRYTEQPGDTINSVLSQVGISQADIGSLFYNSSLLVTRNTMAPWLGYVQVRPDPHCWDLDIPIQAGDRLGVFGIDMPALVV